MDKKEIQNIIDWIKQYVENAKANGVVVGMSGGKDSFVVAKLCSLALGKDKVWGVIMPNGDMADIDDAVSACKFLDIKYSIININKAYSDILDEVKKTTNNDKLADLTTINTAPRLRMTTLYAVAGDLNCLVANTSNLSEAMVGYTTKWGDNVGDFAPLINFTKTEVCKIGEKLGLPKNLVYKQPSDGLSGKSDEEKLGFSYDELDDFIRNGKIGESFDKIMQKHKISMHKRAPIARFENNIMNNFNDWEKKNNE